MLRSGLGFGLLAACWGALACTPARESAPQEGRTATTGSAASREDEARIVGRVVDEDRQPVAYPRVHLSRKRPARLGEGYEWTLVDDVDSAGRFIAKGLAPGVYNLEISSSDHPPTALLELTVDASTDELDVGDVVLRRGAEIEGVVRSADGEPVAEAWIRVMARLADSFGGPRTHRGQTDDEGRFSIRGVPPGPVLVLAHVGEHRLVWKELVVEAGSRSVDLSFEAGVELSGRVVDAGGNPVPEVHLDLRKTELPRPWDSSSPLIADPRWTDATGAFVFADVQPGSYWLTARRDGFAPRQLDSAIEVGASDVRGVAVRLSRGTTLRGRLRGLEPGRLEDAWITASGQEPGTRRVEPDADGRYVFENLSPGNWRVVARVAGAADTVSGQVLVAPGQETAELDLDLSAGPVLRGVVLNNGRPLAHANLAVSCAEGPAHLETDAQGRFQVRYAPSETCWLTIFTWDFRHTTAIRPSPGGEVRVEVTTAQIVGTLRDRVEGQPISGAQLVLLPDDVEGRDRTGVAPGSVGKSDPRGRFQITTSRMGRWRVIARKVGYVPVEQDVEVVGAGTTGPLDMRMTRSGGVSFQAVLESGASPDEVSVAVLDASGRHVYVEWTESSSTGEFRLSEVVPGGSLLIAATGSAVTKVAVPESGRLGRVHLRPGGRLRIFVRELEEDGEVARVRLVAADGSPYSGLLPMGPDPTALPVQGGRAQLGGLAPGPWSFEVEHSDGRRWHGEVTVSAGETAEVSLL